MDCNPEVYSQPHPPAAPVFRGQWLDITKWGKPVRALRVPHWAHYLMIKRVSRIYAFRGTCSAEHLCQMAGLYIHLGRIFFKVPVLKLDYVVIH